MAQAAGPDATAPFLRRRRTCQMVVLVRGVPVDLPDHVAQVLLQTRQAALPSSPTALGAVETRKKRRSASRSTS